MKRLGNSKAIATAASKAGTIADRFAALEREAQRINAERMQDVRARVLLDSQGLHVLLRDQNGAVLEIAEGKIAIAVSGQQGGGGGE